MNLANLIGQTLDQKYRIERELGKGGMGAVYLATHIGTERPVAVKVIVPQFMQRAEFVERFKREARAAGRLRHPNVVDVTDFGFDETPQGRVAYLVMEYLDGCTLGEILEEEKQLPLEWSLDILEQVSSAIQEAHHQGIIHRDLKPDNIWLEPNQRGGYTVKVLDFGIAKLEENLPDETALEDSPSLFQTRAFAQNLTAPDANQTQMISERRNSTIFSESATVVQTEISGEEAGTLIQPIAEIDLESGTAIMPLAKRETVERENVGTRLLSAQVETGRDTISRKSTAELTRVGAVLGTPLYMSPEQCRGEKLDARSDIYSLAVIAYQMLAGKTPFEGDYKAVMHSHIENEPPPLEAKKVPNKVKRAILAALSKNPEARPQTAETFASQLRAHSEGVGKLLQKALVIYSQHIQTFLWISFWLSLPMILLTVGHFISEYLTLAEIIPSWLNSVFNVTYMVATFFLSMWFGSAMIGVITWVVVQVLAAPLSQMSWKPALRVLTAKWKSVVGTVTRSALFSFLGFIFGIPLGIVLFSYWFVRLCQSFLTGKENASSARIRKAFGELLQQLTFKSFLIFAAKAFSFVLVVFSGLYWSVRYALVSPILMMENLRGGIVLKRSAALTERVYWTTVGTMLIYLILPIMISGVTAKLASSMVDFGEKENTSIIETGGVKIRTAEEPNIGIKIDSPTDDGAAAQISEAQKQKELDDALAKAQEQVAAQPLPETVKDEFREGIEKGKAAVAKAKKAAAEKAKAETPEQRMTRRIAQTAKETLIQIFWLPISILLGSFSSITLALLYLKSRQAGGESMNDLLGQFEFAARKQSNWEKRVNERLIQSGKITGKSSG